MIFNSPNFPWLVFFFSGTSGHPTPPHSGQCASRLVRTTPLFAIPASMQRDMVWHQAIQDMTHPDSIKYRKQNLLLKRVP